MRTWLHPAITTAPVSKVSVVTTTPMSESIVHAFCHNVDIIIWLTHKATRRCKGQYSQGPLFTNPRSYPGKYTHKGDVQKVYSLIPQVTSSMFDLNISTKVTEWMLECICVLIVAYPASSPVPGLEGWVSAHKNRL